MKIAALYDIHGNLPALNAVLVELEEVQPDLILIGGDIVFGPLPRQTLERVLQLGERVRFIHGNGDCEIVATFDGQPLNRRYLPPISEKGQQEAQWVAGQLTHAQRNFLASLPDQLVLEITDLGNTLFCHATVRSDEEIFTPLTSDERLNAIFSQVKQDFVVCGHTHIQFERTIGNLRILNAGSVGMPAAAQPGAYWLLLSSEGYEFRHTPYDGEAAAQVIRAAGNPLAEEFVKNNVLSVPTIKAMSENLERLANKYGI
ncbi:DeoR family transcriptional regulator [Reticulibacter mediterranei]|uniref:DeoR family transcriptional regulator n=1 Tax=Reticulibacter mediterranei TaxID=2778369 RepID=A0A8J3N611_9CHLR|nr:metallophosphoesterase family protein [Reticulibacter mediterranei]GHO97058.1 DeoR family transcriptional regulator [Reticulibacter mediterranei]